MRIIRYFIKHFWPILAIFNCLSCDLRISNEIQPPLKIYGFEGSQFRLWDVLEKNKDSIGAARFSMKTRHGLFIIKIPNEQKDTVRYAGYFMGYYDVWLNRPDTSGFTIMTIKHRGESYSMANKNDKRDSIKSLPYLDILENKFIQPLRKELRNVVDYRIEPLEKTSRGDIFSVCKDSINCDTILLVRKLVGDSSAIEELSPI